jgi:arsenite methyltransferase
VVGATPPRPGSRAGPSSGGERWRPSPCPDASVDVAISNGVLNLSARKSRALAEIYRVLAPGGRICMADLTVEGELPPEVANDQSAWAG